LIKKIKTVFILHFINFAIYLKFCQEKTIFLRPVYFPDFMQKVIIDHKEFAVSIPSAKIKDAVKRMAMYINKDFHGETPLFLGILNGSFMFVSDLLKEIKLDCKVSFVRLSSYSGCSSTGKVKELLGINEDISGKPVIILEDIVETGNTLENIVEKLNTMHPKRLCIATLLLKPGAFSKKIKIDYTGIEIPNDFIIGYGLDYKGFGRNLKDIYSET